MVKETEDSPVASSRVRVTKAEEMNPAGNYPEVILESGADVEITEREENGKRIITVTAAGDGRGASGKDGAPGKRGDRGEQGEQGDKGDKGERGEQGFKGEQGDIGLRGSPGDQGDRGERGPKGDKGNRGEPGQNGQPGRQGPPGEDGADASAPTGGIIKFIGSVAPEGYLMCDGVEYPRSSFPTLSELIPGDEDTFAVPDWPNCIVRY